MNYVLCRINKESAIFLLLMTNVFYNNAYECCRIFIKACFISLIMPTKYTVIGIGELVKTSLPAFTVL